MHKITRLVTGRPCYEQVTSSKLSLSKKDVVFGHSENDLRIKHFANQDSIIVVISAPMSQINVKSHCKLLKTRT